MTAEEFFKLLMESQLFIAQGPYKDGEYDVNIGWISKLGFLFVCLFFKIENTFLISF